MPALGAVASGHPSTTDAAVQVLRAGGNAVDAAVAAALAAGVCEPLLTGLGGGGLATIREAGSGKVHVLWFCPVFPGIGCGLAPRDFRALPVDYGPATQVFFVGRGAAAVPGMAPGLLDLWRRWGTLPLPLLAAPAIRLATEGWRVTAGIEGIATMLRAITSSCSRRMDSMFNPGGRPLPAGTLFQPEGLVQPLRDFAEEGAAPFVSGTHARALVEGYGPPRGSLSAADLASFGPRLLEPLAVPFRGAVVFVPPVPCAGGALLAFGLRLLDLVLPERLASRDVALAALAHVMEATDRARRSWFDRDLFEPGAVDSLLSEANLERRAAEIRGAMAGSSATGPAMAGRRVPARGPATVDGDDPVPAAAPGSGTQARIAGPGNTTHISVVDAEGGAVALTSSNGETCGDLWPGTDIAVNNFLGEEDLHPRGFHLGPPGAPIRTMMTPTLVEWPDGAVAALGSGGANRIRTAMLQVISHLLDGTHGLADAVLEPRMHVEAGAAQFEEAGAGPALPAAAAGPGRAVTAFSGLHLYFGGVHVAARRGDGRLEAFGDPRRGGDGRAAT